MEKQLLEYIEYALKAKSPLYQLGFLRAVLVQLILSDNKNLAIFKQIVSAANDRANKQSKPDA